MVKLTVTLPTKLFDVNAMKGRIAAGLDASATKVKAGFEQETASWQKKPAFTVAKTGDFSRVIGTDDKIFIIQDLGSKPHTILPKHKKVLRFDVNGAAVFTKHVNHPGTKPKKISEKVAEATKPAVQAAMDEAFRR